MVVYSMTLLVVNLAPLTQVGVAVLRALGTGEARTGFEIL